MTAVGVLHGGIDNCLMSDICAMELSYLHWGGSHDRFPVTVHSLVFLCRRVFALHEYWNTWERCRILCRFSISPLPRDGSHCLRDGSDYLCYECRWLPGRLHCLGFFEDRDMFDISEGHDDPQ